ncbi:MAG: DUF167 domain-containing protein, partial [Ignavibacteriales bacterium]|nr:DUF167 domain-containing protein [Ignavibacteriales bacterium]
PNARRNEVTMREDGGFLVLVKAPAAEGKANKAVVEVLADFFKKPKSSVAILKGKGSRRKIVEIL